MHSASIFKSARHLARFGFLIVMGAMYFLSSLHAQPSLNFKRVTVNWPTIELYFVADCSGSQDYSMTKQDFRIFENGVEIEQFTQWCPDPTIHCAISVSLVFDASSSMDGLGSMDSKRAGHAFVDRMDGVIDEATIVAFNSEVTVLQQMTTIKQSLHSAIDTLESSGKQAVWDGIYFGIEELIQHGQNQCRAVIIFTNGLDNSSTRTPSEIISIANRNRIRVFNIGMGQAINSNELQQIALLTGGKYYQNPHWGQIAAIYQEISAIIFPMTWDCIVTYERNCTDGSLRTVELQLVDFCGGTDSRTKTYRAPLDTSTFSELYMKLGEEECIAGQQVTVPLNMSRQADTALFRPLTFTLRFDDTCLQFIRVSTPSHSLLAGMPVIATPVTGGVEIRTTEAIQFYGEGLLMEFEFLASDPRDTTYCKLEVVDAAFDQGCQLPVVEAGGVQIIPSVLSVNSPPDPMFSLTVHPEPNDGAFTVNIKSETNEKGRIHLFDMLGRKVYEGSEFEVTGSTLHHVTLPDIPPGTYIMRLDLDSQPVFRKITRR